MSVCANHPEEIRKVNKKDRNKREINVECAKCLPFNRKHLFKLSEKSVHEQMLDKYTHTHTCIHNLIKRYVINKCLTIESFVNETNKCGNRIPKKITSITSDSILIAMI